MWDGPTFQSYYIHLPQNVRAFLDGEDPSYLLTVVRWHASQMASQGGEGCSWVSRQT